MEIEVGDGNSQFQEKQEMDCFSVEHRGTPTCPGCTEKVAVLKNTNVITQLDKLRRMHSTREMRKKNGNVLECSESRLRTLNT